MSRSTNTLAIRQAKMGQGITGIRTETSKRGVTTANCLNSDLTQLLGIFNGDVDLAVDGLCMNPRPSWIQFLCGPRLEVPAQKAPVK